MFKKLIRERRCLIPANCYYEWKERPAGAGSSRGLDCLTPKNDNAKLIEREPGGRCATTLRRVPDVNDCYGVSGQVQQSPQRPRRP